MEEIFVEVVDKEINNNNIISLAPFQYMDLIKNEPFIRRTDIAKGSKTCELCHRNFDSYSILYTHQSKSCYTDLGSEIKYPIEIIFPDWELPLFADFLKQKNLMVNDKSNDLKSVVVDKDSFEITLRQIYYSSITKYNLEQWYYPIEEFGKKIGKTLTPKTIFVRLSEDDIKLIQRWSSISLSQVVGMEIRPTQEEQTKRENFEDRVTEIMHKEGGGEKFYFCRLSTRSPKDGVSARDEEKKETESEPQPEPEPKVEDDRDFNRLTKKMNKLQVKDGVEVFDLITRSQRIFSDIMNHFQYNTPNTTTDNFSLILRDWVPMPQDHEFRCYVKNRRITAISQYQCYLYFDKLQNKEYVEKLRDVIVDFHETIKEAVPVDSYVMDIVVFPDFTCMIVEFNPFGPHLSSGAALFNWIKDFDLLTGNTDRQVPAIRILKKLITSDQSKLL